MKKKIKDEELKEFCEFSKRLKQARNNKKLTISALAKKVFVNHNTISNYEKIEIFDEKDEFQVEEIRRKYPTIFTAKQLVEALDVSIDWLFDFKEYKYKKSEPELEANKIISIIVDITENKYSLFESTIDIGAEYAINPDETVIDTYKKNYEAAIATNSLNLRSFIVEYRQILEKIKGLKELELDLEIEESTAKNLKNKVIEKYKNLLKEEIENRQENKTQ